MKSSKFHIRTVALALVLLFTYCQNYAQRREAQPVDAEVDYSQLKTFGTAGKEQRILSAVKEAEIFNYLGKGCLTHMWFGGEWPGYERTRIKVYVDDERNASIDMEMGPGNGVGTGFGDTNAPWGIGKFGKTGQPSGIYNTYRIPFGKHIRVTAQLAADVKDNPPFWWIIRGTENLPLIISGIRLPENARLKLYKRENITVKRLEEFELCNVGKSGLLYQVMMSARSTNLNFMEGEIRAYLNGQMTPLMLSSGLEDYFLGTYYFRKGLYYTPVAGLTYIDKTNSTFSAYRFHDDDPIFFRQGLRLTNRAGEQDQQTGRVYGDPQETTYTTYTWIYQW